VLSGLPSPEVDEDSRPFWEACANQELVLPRCLSCGRFRWPPGPGCPHCQGRGTTWERSRGLGQVYSWVVARQAMHPAVALQVPYVVALIELPEQVRIVGNIVGYSCDEVFAGLAVEVFFETRPDGRTFPNFRAAAAEQR